MKQLIDIVMVALVLIDLALLGISRLQTSIRLVAVQGGLLGILPVLLRWSSVPWSMTALALAAFAFKGVVFPWLLLRTMRVVGIRREAEPYIGYATALIVGVLLIAVSFYLSSHWMVHGSQPANQILLAGALTMLLTGLLLAVSRRQAISQVLGYLVLENGVYALGLVLLRETPFLVELAILLDAFVAVFVMRIAIHNIKRGFDHIDVAELHVLKG